MDVVDFFKLVKWKRADHVMRKDDGRWTKDLKKSEKEVGNARDRKTN